MSVYLEYDKLKYSKLTLFFILLALYLGYSIAVEDYLTSAAILVLPALLLSPFQLLLVWLVIFQINAILLPDLSIGPMGIKPNDLVILLIMVKLALDFLLNGGSIYWRNWFIPRKIKLTVALFILFSFITQIKLLVLADSSEFIASTVSYVRFLTNMILIVIVPAAIKKESQLRVFIFLFVLFIVIQGVIGNLQFFSGYDIFGTVKAGAFRQDRVAGLLYEPNSFGIYILLGFCIFIGLFVYKLFSPVSNLTILFIFLTAIIFTQSRNTWLSFLAILPLIAWELNVRRKGFIVVVLFVILSMVGAIYSDLMSERMLKQAEEWSEGSENNSYAKRWQSMSVGVITAIEENYLLGSGWSTLERASEDVVQSMDLQRGVNESAHSTYIQLFSDVGVFALAAFLVIIYKFITLARRLSKEAAYSFWKAVTLGIFLWLSSLVFWFTTGQLTAGSPTSNLFWLVLGLLICIYKFQSPRATFADAQSPSFKKGK